MKLKILNIDKIIGRYPGVTIHSVRELEDFYEFDCSEGMTYGTGSVTQRYIRLRRETGGPSADGKRPTYYFDTPGPCPTSVTADWFQNMANAVEAISGQYEMVRLNPKKQATP